MSRPFRFGVYAGWAADREAWLTTARRAEELGYQTLLLVDHLGHQLAPLTALGAAGAVTRRIRLGSCVFANDFRHPLMLAREAATVDLLSDGRFELGLGAGYRTSDYRQLGITYDRAGLRIDRMQEALGLIKRLLRGERVDHRGPHYRLSAARIAPLPVQRPRPPIMVGGGGPRLLRLAAREAEIVGLAPMMSAAGRPILGEAGEAATRRKVEIVRAAAGARFDRLELSAFVADCGLLTGSPRATVAALKWPIPRLVGGSPYLLYGTPRGLREELLRRREAIGISYYVIPSRRMEEMAPIVDELAER